MSSASFARGTHSFGLLWLTDLHYGQSGQAWLWPNCREDFLRDLAVLHEECGPWDAVVFTGDLVYSGHDDQFKRLGEELASIWETVGKLQPGAIPVLLSVPGNHDLARPDANAPTTVAFRHAWTSAEVQAEFWNNPDSEYRRHIITAHSAYSTWSMDNGLPRLPELKAGLLPGEFSGALTKNGASLGFVGLNTTFLQLTGGDYQGKLDLRPRQLAEACGGDYAKWLKAHSASLLLTHQPPDWLAQSAGPSYLGGIYTPENFVAHLYGHMHESKPFACSTGAGTERRQIQGCSLYGLEHFGEAFDRKRFKFGYAAMRIEMAGTSGCLYVWPRKAVLKHSGCWRLGPDQDNDLLLGKNYLSLGTFPLNAPLPACPTASLGAATDIVLARRCSDTDAVVELLGHAGHPLPLEVVAKALGMADDRLERLVGTCLEAAPFRDRDQCSLLPNLGSAIVGQEIPEAVARALELLIGYIRAHRSGEYVDTAIEMSTKCIEAHPSSVCGLFNAVDRILKRRGDKRKVYDAANLTIRAAREARGELRPDEDVEKEAKALICGRSWVLQRNGQLAKAKADAERSLQLGMDLGWDRNTAFCRKCMGRIHRMEAEQEPDQKMRRDLLKQSLESLREAVTIFSGMTGIGPDHPEVGDCYSLTARTFLVAGQLKEVRDYLDKAKARLVDEDDKDYWDYLILEGDYAFAKSNYDVALGHYDKVLEASDAGDCEKSEIRARALRQRAETMVKVGRMDAAVADLEHAAAIWGNLQERRAGAGARWRLIVLRGTLSSQSISCLDGEPDTVKVIAANLHQEKLAVQPTRGPRRSEPPTGYWRSLVSEARKVNARQDLE